MSQQERFGTRDRSYSAWHRMMSTMRFVGRDSAKLLSMIDADVSFYIEMEDGTWEPLALMETALDVGQDQKSGTCIKNLARRAGIPAILVLYKLSTDDNPADKKFKDIASFRVKRLWPEHDNKWESMSPSEWAAWLVKLRRFGGDMLDFKDKSQRMF